MNALEEMDKLSGLSWDDKVSILAVKFKSLESVATPPPSQLTHRFEPGFYIRTMTLPAETIVLGRKHLRGHEVRLTKGSATYITARGKMRVSAPFMIFTAPGFSMVGYIHEDSEVETWHTNPDELRDVELLESRDFAPAELTLARGQELLTGPFKELV